MLRVGDQAPDFTLESDRGERVTLSALRDKPVVLFFYPKDDTPGCTIECKEFRDALPDLRTKAHVFGISADDVTSHRAFRDKYSLNFPLLADPRHEVCDAFGVWGQKTKGEGIFRTTFIVAADGRLAKVFENVKPEGHARQVLEAL
jgi:peroxiredoxin Q/BCP